VASYVLQGLAGARVIPFEPYGYDERQLCSPGFDLPIGRLTRSVNAGYAEYHSSADDLSLIQPQCLEQSYLTCRHIVEVLEGDGRYVNTSPKGEPQLGKRGLYGPVGGRSPAQREQALLWVLNQSDAEHSLLDIAQRSGIDFNTLYEAATALEAVGLVRRSRDGQGIAGPKRRVRSSSQGGNRQWSSGRRRK
jgi:aminopeptidase-like protein